MRSPADPKPSREPDEGFRLARRDIAFVVIGAVLALGLAFGLPFDPWGGTRRVEPLADHAQPDDAPSPPLKSLDVSELRQELERLKGDMTRNERHLRKLALGMIDRRNALIEMARHMYATGSGGSIEALVLADSFPEIDQRADYLRSAFEGTMEDLARMRDDRRRLKIRIERLERQRRRAARLAREAERRRAEELAAQANALVSPEVPNVQWSVNWDAIAMCESGGNWSIDSTYDGGLQFHPQTWLGYGGGQYAPYAYMATKEQQIAIAERVLAGQGPGAWPHCFQYGV